MNKTLTYKSKRGTIRLNKEIEKILVPCICAGCKAEGMAYEDPDNIKQKPHYCLACKKRLNK